MSSQHTLLITTAEIDGKVSHRHIYLESSLRLYRPALDPIIGPMPLHLFPTAGINRGQKRLSPVGRILCDKIIHNVASIYSADGLSFVCQIETDPTARVTRVECHRRIRELFEICNGAFPGLVEFDLENY